MATLFWLLFSYAISFWCCSEVCFTENSTHRLCLSLDSADRISDTTCPA